MKRMLFTIFLVGPLCWLACKKYRNTADSIAGRTTSSIRGRLFLYDYLTGNGDTVPLPKMTVSIGAAGSGNPLDFIQTTTTDSLGYFVFQYLDSTQLFHLNFTDTGAGHIMYLADTVMKPGNDSLAFIAYPSFLNNNGFYYFFASVQDTSGPIAGVSVCVFTNAALVADTCLGSAYQLTSDSRGRAWLFQLPAGTYYSRIHVAYPAKTETIYDTLVITKTKLVPKKIFL